MVDSYNLNRFISAQEPVINQAYQELEAGEKRTHWMWFIFPQIHGLGQSEIAKLYSISSRNEAIVYLAHPVLGKRLEECSRIVRDIIGRFAREIFGHTDALKLRSSMTLFASVADQTSVFGEVLSTYYDGKQDQSTLAIMERLEQSAL